MPKYMRKRAYWFIYPMLTIAFIGIAKYFWVNFNSILLAFSIESNGEQVYTLDNFRTLIGEFAAPGSGMWQYLKNTLAFFLMYIVKTLTSFVVAYFLYRRIWGHRALSVIFYLPCLVSPIILVNVWKKMLESSGVVAMIAEMLGIEYTNPLTSSATAMTTILIYSFWAGFGVSLLVFVGAMNRIPGEILEAARIDGCNTVQEFFRIIVPLAWETLSTMLLLTLMSIFTATGPILYFTRGNFETKTLSFYIFMETYNGTYNYPTAVGMFFTIIALPIVALGRWLMNKVSEVEY